MWGSAEIIVLSGAVALTEIPQQRDYMVRYNTGGYSLRFKRPGRFDVSLSFKAGVVKEEEWESTSFGLAPAPMRPIILRGFSENAIIEVSGASEPTRDTPDIHSCLGSK